MRAWQQRITGDGVLKRSRGKAAAVSLVGGLVLVLTAGCVAAGRSPDTRPGVPVTHEGIWATEAIYPPECHRGQPLRTRIEIACADMAARADALDGAATPKRSTPPVITLLPDGRLRYTDTARHDRNHLVHSVLSGLEVRFNAEGWKKIPTGDEDHLHFQYVRSWGALDIKIALRQVAKGIVEAHAVIESLEPVT